MDNTEYLSLGLRPLPPAPFRSSDCLHFDILGDHFSTSGANWEASFAARGQPGGPWVQQDGFEMANNNMFVDFLLIWGLVYVSFLGTKMFNKMFFQACSQVTILSIFDSKCWPWGLFFLFFGPWNTRENEVTFGDVTDPEIGIWWRRSPWYLGPLKT